MSVQPSLCHRRTPSPFFGSPAIRIESSRHALSVFWGSFKCDIFNQAIAIRATDLVAETKLMPLERDGEYKSLIDVLDRILDRGIVVDAWVRVSLVGIDFITLEARVVVASIETYLLHAQALGASPQTSTPPPLLKLRSPLRQHGPPKDE